MSRSCRTLNAKSKFPRQDFTIHKPKGALHPRVQAVGANHFGIVPVDCAKHRSRWLLADFFGNVLVQPTTCQHTKAGLESALDDIRKAADEHRLKDLVVVLERTGNYHKPLQRACRQKTIDVRTIHPFITHRFREAASPDIKTDDIDLAAIFRGTVAGFALDESSLPPTYAQLQALARHRRELVRQRATLRCKLRELLHSLMPGLADCFDDFFSCPIPLTIVRRFCSRDQLLDAGADGVTKVVQQAGLRCQPLSIQKIFTWANNAPPPHPDASVLHRVYLDLDDDRLQKSRKIALVERDLIPLLCRTPYVLLLSIVGINVPSAAELAGEMGPVEHYRHSRAITGRAGIFPCRYQSDLVDHSGKLGRRAHRRLRAAIMTIADNLLHFNNHFKALGEQWSKCGKAPVQIHIKAASTFCRIAFAMLAGNQLFQHPACQERDYLLRKLLRFQQLHDIEMTPQATTLAIDGLLDAVDLLPIPARAQEAATLQEDFKSAGGKRGGEPTLVGTILPKVLARLLPQTVQSDVAGDQVPN